MANMGYCRFQNTAQDLIDCERHITDDLPSDEHKARELLIEYARLIVEVADAGEVPDEPEATDEP